MNIVEGGPEPAGSGAVLNGAGLSRWPTSHEKVSQAKIGVRWASCNRFLCGHRGA